MISCSTLNVVYNTHIKFTYTLTILAYGSYNLSLDAINPIHFDNNSGVQQGMDIPSAIKNSFLVRYFRFFSVYNVKLIGT